ncbi:LPXTG cell wall anchor domain-containing protein [Limosilactobacillus secaliphilus]|nr:LPXTG cell wall anchor domain-containing protein [Limosilactobacillus secaliphilus]
MPTQPTTPKSSQKVGNKKLPQTGNEQNEAAAGLGVGLFALLTSFGGLKLSKKRN